MNRFVFILFFAVLFLSRYTAISQTDTSLRLVKTIKTNVADIAVDNLDNIYVLSGTDQLTKFNAAGDSVSVYNNTKRFGKLFSIDVTNPLKVLLYYKDFSTIVLLDRLLALRSTIDLRQHDILQASAIGLSYDNNIWLFDAYSNKLKKINEEGTVLLETPDFRMLFNEPVAPQQIMDQNGLVYLYDSANGLFVFDYYGTFKRKIPITGWKHLNISNRFIFGLYDNALNSYNMTTLMQSRQSLPASFVSYNKFILSNNKLYATGKEAVMVYSVPH